MRFHAGQAIDCGPTLVANPERLEVLKQGVEVWNPWRVKEPLVAPDLSGTNLNNAYLCEADLTGADLGTRTSGARTSPGRSSRNANLSGTKLSGANLHGADLREANLTGAHLLGANLTGANLSGAKLSKCAPRGSCADLFKQCGPVEMPRSRRIRMEREAQRNDETARLVVITAPNEPEVTVDNIEVAQFVFCSSTTKKFAMSSTPSARRACSCSVGSPRAGSRS